MYSQITSSPSQLPSRLFINEQQEEEVSSYTPNARCQSADGEEIRRRRMFFFFKCNFLIQVTPTVIQDLVYNSRQRVHIKKIGVHNK